VISASIMDAATINSWMTEIAVEVRANRDYLIQLDAAIGDGDHGSNMTRGFEAVVGALATDHDSPPGKLLMAAGKTLVSSVGGASGPLWGTALRYAGRRLGGEQTFDAAQLGDAIQAALDGVVELGAAAEGEKTMVDALAPAVRAYKLAVADGSPVVVAVRHAAEAAEEGMRATVPMQAKKGRASYLGERSIGHQDPGATSAALILRALERSLSDSS
jgi:dihydroxyacetone kinase-like protein